MNQSFKRIAPHLYKRQYQAANGEWTTLYYGILVDWKGKRRSFPLGSELRTARGQLKVFEADNVKRKDFDKEKEERRKAAIAGMTLAEWLDRYLELVKHLPSWETKKSQSIHLKRLLGSLSLSEVNRVRIMEYKSRRLSEPLIRHGKAVEGTNIMGSTANREVGCLITALNLAADEGLCDGAPRIKKEREIPRDRTLTDAEYRVLLEVSPQWLQRVMIAANEAALDRGVLINLPWDSVRDGLIKLSRAKTGAGQRIGISPALQGVLDELRAESRRIPNMERKVFVKDGKPVSKETLRYAFDKAVRDAKVEDFQFRDFRHCARTRWAEAGLPFEVAEIGLGHKLPGLVGRYTNLTDSQIRDAFQKMFTRCLQEKSDFASTDERSLQMVEIVGARRGA